MGASTDFTSRAFDKFLGEHRLLGTRSSQADALFIPPRPLGSHQKSCDMQWTEFSGEGILEAFSIIYIAPTAMIQEGYGRDNPYCAGIVRLKEGPAISAQILGVDVRKPESIVIGAPVSVEFIDAGEGANRKTRLAFRLKA
jgi:uncharacterized OB-fold protein